MTRTETKQALETVTVAVQLIVTLGGALLAFLNQRQQTKA